ncbi:putative efflux pump antibiotic resistance protein [Talaromyces proteolyticus]|uniref:Efflux pump antibiotic resistance protein n=1 Tax=Talaromyces proteolyticus TaxID=1131652 RepID=A0AAD4KGG4_9EURO|nr:putative efflux pump antibiotic resistance protein [Talaromyces proteolyticus]KAH8690543.1 putative efflux pump antibiotic resistance protein [Talaromyces proteolyticus]
MSLEGMRDIQSEQCEAGKAIFPSIDDRHSATDDLEPENLSRKASSNNNDVGDAQQDDREYLTGWRLLLTTIGLLLSLLLVNMEVSIVSTALISIAADLSGFSTSSWIVTGFLASYTGFFIIWTKLSDFLGRKIGIISSSIVFIAFSGACGGSSTMTQLIVFRVFQGIGASGVYGICVLSIYELVPPYKLPMYGSMVAVTMACATAAGPLLGGAITDVGHSVWRWVFYLNLPAGTIAIGLIAIAMPANFPNGIRKTLRHQPLGNPLSSRQWGSQLDIGGATLLLSGTFLLIIALFEATTRLSWSSTVTIGLLVGSGVSWVGFFLWERAVTLREGKIQPVFPWHFFFNRPWMGMLLVSFLVGFPFNVVVVNLPQRFQTTLDLSPFEAGVRLLPYVLGSSFGAIVSNGICSRRNIPFIALFFVGGIMQVIGLALLATLTTEANFPHVGYFEETLCGVGLGVAFSILILATPFTADKQYLAVATGAIIQLRFLGGAIGLGIASAIMNSSLRSQLASVLSSEQLGALLDNAEVMTRFSPTARKAIQLAFVKIYNQQLEIMTGVSGAQLLAVFLIWKRGSQLRAARQTAN